jgi:oligopeptide/dipeptide ABC transporter ATP-binding protein
MIFQDPQSSLNPALTIYNSLQDQLRICDVYSKKERVRIIGDILESVNLDRDSMHFYPHQFSGGERQRIGIARALCTNPRLIICDEAVSALDVSIQAQVLKLLKKLQKDNNLTYIFISHDLSVVEYISDRIAVMYLGEIVELADADELFQNPIHPYTKALLSAIPVANLDKKTSRTILSGDVPNPISPPTGCPFHPRCVACMEGCKSEKPKLKKIYSNGNDHYVACHPIE